VGELRHAQPSVDVPDDGAAGALRNGGGCGGGCGGGGDAHTLERTHAGREPPRILGSKIRGWRASVGT
jgi:hypothetical protein